MGTGVREMSGEPALDSENGEEMLRMLPGVDIVLGNLPPQSPGTLYITTRQVIWLSDADKTKGYAVPFLSISLHAVSRDPHAYPVPCLYTQIDAQADEDHNSDSSDSDSNPLHQDLSTITEIRFVPSDPTHLDTLFELFCEGAELNPEPNHDAEDAEEHDWIFGTDQMEYQEPEQGYNLHNPLNCIGHSNGDHDLARSVLELQIDDQQFKDAEEDEGDGTHS